MLARINGTQTSSSCQCEGWVRKIRKIYCKAQKE